MSQTPSGHDPQGAYQLGRMAEALHQNTVTLAKLVESVDENSRSTARLANRQDRMEQTIEQIQADQRKMINIGMTGQSTEADVRKRLEDGGATPGSGTQASFVQFLKKEKAGYAQIVKSANIQAE